MKYRTSHLKTIDEFVRPEFQYDEAHLRYNANIPIYGLTLIFDTKNIPLVFKNFLEIKSLLSEFFYPLKIHLKTKFKINLSVPSLGRILWLKMRYLIYWKLGALKIMKSEQQYGTTTFCGLILNAKNIIL